MANNPTAKVGVEVKGESKDAVKALDRATMAINRVGDGARATGARLTQMATGVAAGVAGLGLATVALGSLSAAVSGYIERSKEMTASADHMRQTIQRVKDEMLSHVVSAEGVANVTDAVRNGMERLSLVTRDLFRDSTVLTDLLAGGLDRAFTIATRSLAVAANTVLVFRGAVVGLQGGLQYAIEAAERFGSQALARLADMLAAVQQKFGAAAGAIAPFVRALNTDLGAALERSATAAQAAAQNTTTFANNARDNAASALTRMGLTANQTRVALAGIGEQMLANVEISQRHDDAVDRSRRRRASSTGPAGPTAEELAKRAAEARYLAELEGEAKVQRLLAESLERMKAQDAERLAVFTSTQEKMSQLEAARQASLDAAKAKENALYEERVARYQDWAAQGVETTAALIRGEESVAQAGKRTVGELIGAYAKQYTVLAVGALAAFRWGQAAKYAAAAITASVAARSLGATVSTSGAGGVPAGGGQQQQTITNNTNAVYNFNGIMGRDQVETIAQLTEEANRRALI